MSSMDLGRYKRIVQYFWDPEPKNEKASSIWCLGNEYMPSAAELPDTSNISQSTPSLSTEWSQITPEDSMSNSVDDGLAYQEPEAARDGNNGWPASFLEDVESKLWLTYRSNFAPIPRSVDPKASAGMSIGVRIRSQLIDQEGFTSDTGWGCMIRSGQSLLANTILVSKLGRGLSYSV
jgi:cysteine protease ATG4